MFDGRQLRVEAQSRALGCTTTIGVFLPPAAAERQVPVVYWLSGLTCDDQNFVIKAGAQRVAAELGVALVAPDTSPRGDGVPDDPDGLWDFGIGAGFYVDATQQPWRSQYRMYSYVVDELPSLIDDAFAIDVSCAAISGHSMGGHGALTIALKNPDKYRAVSAFSPICAPSRVPWGKKALGNYLGPDPANWREYDATELAGTRDKLPPALIDQGDADEFLEVQLTPQPFLDTCRKKGHNCEYRLQAGYDHSYFFIATFIEDHLRHLHKYL